MGAGLGFAHCSQSLSEGYAGILSHVAAWLGGGGKQREKVEEGGDLCGRNGLRWQKVCSEVRQGALGEGGLS